MPKLIFCNQEYREKNSKVGSHRHHCHEIVLYDTQAYGETEINGVNYSFGPGSVALIPKGIYHSEKHYARNPVIFLGFESSGNIPIGVWEEMDHIKGLFYEIKEELRNQEWGFEKIISLKIQEILSYIERRAKGAIGTVKDLAYSKRYIEENYMQNISMGDLAYMTCYSKDRFRHLFTEMFGISPKNYLMQLRLENAKELLVSTDYNCTEIARMCGFSDAGQMTKIMKNAFEKSPKELRKTKTGI